ncbi:MAG: helicase-related protein [Verrucomicrobiia bacterium]
MIPLGNPLHFHGSSDGSTYKHTLTNFSPRLKIARQIPSLPQQGEIDLRIATDCIREGQNPQDCDTFINDDIHWNLVSIIQRFGRIDRIGSVNTAVHLMNFWPTKNLNKYINLKNRVEDCMVLADLSATFGDHVLKNEEIEDIISDDLRDRDRQLLRLKDEVLDLEDLGDSVSFTEFALDDFRLELLKYIEANQVQKAVKSLAATFRKRAASALQSGRGFVLPNVQQQVHETTDLEPVTWLVIKDGKAD